MGIPNVWNPFYENHRHRRHIVIVPLKQQVENDDTNDGLPDRTIPAVFDNAVKSLVQNSALSIFTSYPEFLRLACLKVMIYGCKSSSLSSTSSTSSRCYKINQLEWTVFGRSHRFGRLG